MAIFGRLKIKRNSVAMFVILLLIFVENAVQKCIDQIESCSNLVLLGLFLPSSLDYLLEDHQDLDFKEMRQHSVMK